MEAGAVICPACNAPLSPQAVLCIACGYHLKLKTHLATHVESEPSAAPAPISGNPYAVTVVDLARDRPPRQTPEFDLTERGAKSAKGLVADASMVYGVIALASCVCAPAWLVMLPWYAYRIYQWHLLNATYSELRHPNSFSAHGALAEEFQSARGKLYVGVVAGTVLWIALLGVIVSRYLRYE